MMQCPSCTEKFDSERAVKIHHKLKHGESLSLEKATCKVDSCKNNFYFYPSAKKGLICPECVERGKNIQDVGYDIEPPEKEAEIVEVICVECGSQDYIKKSENSTNNYLCSDSCRSDFQSNRMKGENNPRFVDGESRGKKYNSEWRTVRDKVLERDNEECKICGSKSNLHVHHIKPVREFKEESEAHYTKNAITLCPSCHRNVEYGNKELPKDYLEKYDLVDHNQKTFI